MHPAKSTQTKKGNSGYQIHEAVIEILKVLNVKRVHKLSAIQEITRLRF